MFDELNNIVKLPEPVDHPEQTLYGFETKDGKRFVVGIQFIDNQVELKAYYNENEISQEEVEPILDRFGDLIRELFMTDFD